MVIKYLFAIYPDYRKITWVNKGIKNVFCLLCIIKFMSESFNFLLYLNILVKIRILYKKYLLYFFFKFFLYNHFIEIFFLNILVLLLIFIDSIILRGKKIEKIIKNNLYQMSIINKTEHKMCYFFPKFFTKT